MLFRYLRIQGSGLKNAIRPMKIVPGAGNKIELFRDMHFGSELGTLVPISLAKQTVPINGRLDREDNHGPEQLSFNSSVASLDPLD